jgi:hypothetical protein
MVVFFPLWAPKWTTVTPSRGPCVYLWRVVIKKIQKLLYGFIRVRCGILFIVISWCWFWSNKVFPGSPCNSTIKFAMVQTKWFTNIMIKTMALIQNVSIFVVIRIQIKPLTFWFTHWNWELINFQFKLIIRWKHCTVNFPLCQWVTERAWKDKKITPFSL